MRDFRSLLRAPINGALSLLDLKLVRASSTPQTAAGARPQAEATPRPAPAEHRDWRRSQDYELKNALAFMQGDFFKSLFSDIVNGKCRVSQGYRDDATLREFFAGDEALWRAFLRDITGKNVLEIGPCVASPLVTWDVAAEKHVIEPLYEEIASYQRKTFGTTCFEGLVCHARPAEDLIDGLAGRIDGAVMIRNCLDHTPNWPFILSNIASYMTPGAYLLLWTDLYHRDGVDEGHYNLTESTDAFRRLIENFGFRMVGTYSNMDSPEVNFGCMARRL